MEKTENEVVQKEKRYDFDQICDDQSFFERDGNMRNYFICVSCGFIPMSMIDKDTKYLDLHCKCGGPVVSSSFSEEEILEIIGDIKESAHFRNLLKDACET